MADMGFDNVKLRGATLVWDEVVPDVENGYTPSETGITTGTLFLLNTKFYEIFMDSETDIVTTPFVEPENQWDVVRHSFESLVGGGLAIHFIDTGEWGSHGEPLPEGGNEVPVGKLEEELAQVPDVEFSRVELASGLALVIRKRPASAQPDAQETSA